MFAMLPHGHASHQDYYDARGAVIGGEMAILRALGFHVAVEQPHALLVCYFQQLQLIGGTNSGATDTRVNDQRQRVMRRAWAMLNDCFRLPLCTYVGRRT